MHTARDGCAAQSLSDARFSPAHTAVDKQISYVNHRWLEFTGWPSNEVPGHRWIQLIHPDDVERCGDVYGKAFDGRQPFQVEHRQRRHDGAYRWTVTAGVPRYGTDRSFAGFVGTAVDVTDRKLVELALLESHAALKERTLELERRTTQLSQMASDLTLAEQRARAGLPRRFTTASSNCWPWRRSTSQATSRAKYAGGCRPASSWRRRTTSTRQSRPRGR